MSSAESDQALCMFRRMEAVALEEDALDDSADPGPSDLSLELERALTTTPDERICRIGSCALTARHLMGYAKNAPRDQIIRVVPPSCAFPDFSPE